MARPGLVDPLVLGIAALVVAVGGYGMYDVVMAPHSGARGNGKRAETARRVGFLETMLGGAGMQLCPHKKQVNILLMGTDERTEGGRADTIMLVMIRKDTRRVAAVSVPRDLMVRLPGHGRQKINAIYAYHRRKGDGEVVTARAVSEILNAPVDYYIKTDVTKFANLFDALGGLDLYVDKNMTYDDNWGKLHIRLRKGYQHLDGKQIEGFVRHRHDRRGNWSSDHERNQRQHYVLKELVKQKKNLATVTRLPQVVYALRDMIKTDMKVSELVALGLLARKADMSSVITRTVPTHAYRGSAWYAILEPRETRKMMLEVELGLAGEDVGPDENPEHNEEIGGGRG